MGELYGRLSILREGGQEKLKSLNRAARRLIAIYKVIRNRNTDSAKTSKKMIRVLEELYTNYRDSYTYAFCVFSRDRPLQLHALLSSYFRVARLRLPIYVLFKASNLEFTKAYSKMFEEIASQGEVFAVKEEEGICFKKQVLHLLGKVRADRIVFLVDDIVFIRECSLTLLDRFDLRVFVPSLRLSPHINYSYMVSRYVKKPLLKSDGLFYTWEMRFSEIDWQYPLSLDGNIFLKSDMLTLLKEIEFTSPNTLESRMQEFSALFLKRRGVCFNESRLINIPCNRVQSDFINRSGNLEVDHLLRLWNEGNRILYEDLIDLSENAVHLDFPIRFVGRNL